MKDRVKFFGSNEDLDALRSALTKNGFEEYEGIFTHASVDPVPVSICFVIVTGIGSCIKHHLTQRGKRVVTRETHGEKIIIKGNFSADEIERLLKISHGFEIEDDVEPLPEPNHESEIGFPVGLKKKKGE